MATGLVNPYAVAAPNTRYRDAVLADNPKALWMFDEPYGDNVAVNQGSLGSAYNGLYSGNVATDPLYRGSGTIFGLDAMGRDYYNTTTTGLYGSYVNLPGSVWSGTTQFFPNHTLGNTSWTIECLIRRTWTWVSGRQEWYFNLWHPILIRYVGNYNYMDIQSTNSTYKAAQFSGSYNRNVDYHIVWSFDGTYIEHYINGVYQGAIQWASGYTGMQVTPARALQVGNGSATTHLRGLMAGVAIHDNVLSQAQVTAHYNALL